MINDCINAWVRNSCNLSHLRCGCNYKAFWLSTNLNIEVSMSIASVLTTCPAAGTAWPGYIMINTMKLAQLSNMNSFFVLFGWSLMKHFHYVSFPTSNGGGFLVLQLSLIFVASWKSHLNLADFAPFNTFHVVFLIKKAITRELKRVSVFHLKICLFAEFSGLFLQNKLYLPPVW